MSSFNKPEIVIRQLSISDAALFPEGVRLLNRSQGEDLFAADYLDLAMADPCFYLAGAVMDGVLIGVAVACLIDNFDYYKPFQDDIDLRLAHAQVGSFATMAISQPMRGQGIGQALTRLRLEWLIAKNCDVILGVSWVSGLGHTSDRVFEKAGFHAVKKVELFYYQSSIEKPFYCPGCRVAPCTCAAILYRRDLKIM